MTPTGAIEVEGLTKAYRRAKAPALTNVTLRVNAGEILGLIGPNGAGKTTFFGCLLGLLSPSAGTISIGGRPPDDMEVRRTCGYLPERLQFDRWMTGRSFLAFHHCLARLPAQQRAADVSMMLERVGLDRGRWDAAIKKYSRGMLQRLGLAQALLGDPRFVFLDEPASGVDPAGVLAFRAILTDLKARGITVVLNSHQLDQLERVCDRVAYIEGGSIRQVENLRVSEVGRRVIVVRWIAAADEPAPESVRSVAAQSGSDLVELGPGRGRFAVESDAQAAALLRALVTAGHAVIEAAPEAGRLEKFFQPAPGKEPS